jgi:hypothetical protein
MRSHKKSSLDRWRHRKGWAMFEMHFYVTKTADGLYHIQNVVAGYLGQHHVHTHQDYKKWRRKLRKKERLHFSKGMCGCNLNNGETRDHHGQLTSKLLPKGGRKL